METMILSDHPKLCCNTTCQKVVDVPRPGWRYNNDDISELCDACFVAYHIGKFCDIYHAHLNYWRECKSCKKSIHLGCIVSQGSYVSLKRGGLEIECLDCATTPQAILSANPCMPQKDPFHMPNIDNSTNETVASGPVVCNQTPFMLNSSDLTPSAESVDRLKARGHVSSPPLVEKINEDGSEKLMIGSSKISAPQIISGFKHQVSIPSKEPVNPIPTTLTSLRPPLVVKDKKINKENVSETGGERKTSPSFALGCSGSKSSTKAQDHTQNLQSQTPRIKLQYRYTPRLTDQELKQISRGLNVEVTPLFEKVLSASDIKKSGRLVLPKKCAEVYFPSIEIPGGKTLRIQDLEGKDWELNFRFWPNNNSRMYVLEGFNNYVMTMKLREGDTVMFSRLEPEGKLVIGYRKATNACRSRRKVKKRMIRTKYTSNNVSKGKTISVTVSQDTSKDPTSVHSDLVRSKTPILSKRKPSEQGMVTDNIGNKISNIKTTSTMVSTSSHRESKDLISVHSDVVGSKPSICAKRLKSCEMSIVTASTSKGISKEKAALVMPSSVSHAKPNDPVSQAKPKVGRAKRKQCESGSKSKSSQHEKKMKNLDLASEGARELIRPHPDSNHPSRMVVEGVKLKSYKDGPILGRSNCSAKGSLQKIKNGNLEVEPVKEVKGRDEVAVENVLKEKKKHPRHRAGCSCIVCIQAPSGSKHKLSCECCSCTVARRQRVLKQRRGKSLNPTSQPENIPTPPEVGIVNGGSEENLNAETSSGSGIKKPLPFDLNALPEPDDDSMNAVVPVQELPPGI